MPATFTANISYSVQVNVPRNVVIYFAIAIVLGLILVLTVRQILPRIGVAALPALSTSTSDYSRPPTHGFVLKNGS